MDLKVKTLYFFRARFRWLLLLLLFVTFLGGLTPAMGGGGDFYHVGLSLDDYPLYIRFCFLFSLSILKFLIHGKGEGEGGLVNECTEGDSFCDFNAF